MSEKKAIKREIKGAWDHVKRLRADRSKIYAPAALEVSADELSRSAELLRELGKRLSALNAMPPSDATLGPDDKPKKAPAKRKAKKSASAKS